MPQTQPANPPVEQARELAVVGDGPGAGGSFVITQRYLHDLDAFHAQDLPGQEATFGRTKADSVELDDKRADAHIEAFDRMLANMYGASGDGVHDRLMDFKPESSRSARCSSSAAQARRTSSSSWAGSGSRLAKSSAANSARSGSGSASAPSRIASINICDRTADLRARQAWFERLACGQTISAMASA